MQVRSVQRASPDVLPFLFHVHTHTTGAPETLTPAWTLQLHSEQSITGLQWGYIEFHVPIWTKLGIPVPALLFEHPSPHQIYSKMCRL